MSCLLPKPNLIMLQECLRSHYLLLLIIIITRPIMLFKDLSKKEHIIIAMIIKREVGN